MGRDKTELASAFPIEKMNKTLERRLMTGTQTLYKIFEKLYRDLIGKSYCQDNKQKDNDEFPFILHPQIDKDSQI
jgi:hypothetical protein